MSTEKRDGEFSKLRREQFEAEENNDTKKVEKIKEEIIGNIGLKDAPKKN
jgi:hypothetical protein